MYSNEIEKDWKLADELFSKRKDADYIKEEIAKIDSFEKPSLEEAAMLLQVKDSLQFNQIISEAGKVTEKYHGGEVGLIAPLYFSNVCWNDCSSCDMSKSNRDLKRKTLLLEEYKREIALLRKIGYNTIEIVGGGFDLESGIGKRFLECIEYGRQNIPDFLFFMDSYSLEEYRQFASPEITMIHWQESYYKESYFKMVKSGPKTNFNKRLNSQESFIQAGGKKVGLSVLAGVCDDFLKDVFLLLCHAKYLETNYGLAPKCFGTVRIKPITRKQLGEFSKIQDKQMCLATAMYRLMFPKSNIIITSRETQRTIAEQLKAGATFTNTTCTTVPGGYEELLRSHKIKGGQFYHESPPIQTVKKTVESVGKTINWDKKI